MWKKLTIVYLRYHPSMFLKVGADEVTKILSQNETVKLSLPTTDQNC
jgi:hypothetical protein